MAIGVVEGLKARYVRAKGEGAIADREHVVGRVEVAARGGGEQHVVARHDGRAVDGSGAGEERTGRAGEDQAAGCRIHFLLARVWRMGVCNNCVQQLALFLKC